MSFYDFFESVCGVDINHHLDGLYEIAKTTGWWTPRRGYVIFQHRPDQIHLVDGQLHNDTGPAIHYRDGFEVYGIDGIRVPKRVVMDPKSLTIDEIQKEGNTEIRRIMINRFGPSDYLIGSGAKLVDSSVVHGLLRAVVQDKRGEKWLVGTDGSTNRVYHMAVPSEVKTCHQAHNAICGFDETKIIMEA